MKRTATKTHVVYRDSRWLHKGGPVEHVERDASLRSALKPSVNVRRFNAIVLARKLRLASYVGAPILRKHAKFTNPVIS